MGKHWIKLKLLQMAQGRARQAIRRREANEWLRRNRAPLEAYNKQVQKHGVFSEGVRSF